MVSSQCWRAAVITKESDPNSQNDLKSQRADGLFGTVHDALLTAGRFSPEIAIPLGRFTPNDQNYFLALGVITGAIC